MTSKAITSFRAIAKDGIVRLSGYKSTPCFQNAESETLFEKIRVWRKEEVDFQFGQDYAEYFDGMTNSAATLIHEGPLDISNDRKLTFVDHNVTIGKTYTYWIAAAQGEPAGPVPVKVRDLNVWWSEDKIRAKMLELKEKYPDLVRLRKIGKTVEKRDLSAMVIGHGKKGIALVGAIHAGESGPELILAAVESLLTDNAELFKNVSILAVPVVNLDQRQRQVRGVPWYIRTNSNGVDLNRNFPSDWDKIELGYGLDSSDPDSMTYRGLSPASEPEVQAVISFLQKYRPIAIFSCHCLACVCGKRFLTAKCAVDNTDYGNNCKQIVKSYCEGYSRDLQGQPFNAGNLSFSTTAGSFATWCYRELNVPAFDLEFSEDIEGCQTDKTDETLLKDNQRRHTEGIRSVMKKTGMCNPKREIM